MRVNRIYIWFDGDVQLSCQCEISFLMLFCTLLSVSVNRLIEIVVNVRMDR